MKIGILTYFGDLNCGTNLQAYATLCVIKNKYPSSQVEIIPFHGFRPRILPYKTFNLLSIMKDFNRILKYRNFKKLNLNVRETDCVITDVKKALDYISSRSYDIIYVGADTLLELDRLPFRYDGISAYWLKDIKSKKVLLAASSKNVLYENLSPRQKKEMEIAISQFHAVSVRDRLTYNLFLNFLPPEKITLIVDPTINLIIDSSYADAYISKNKIKLNLKSVLIHTFGDDIWAVDVAKYFTSLGYVVVSFRPASWADYCLNDMSPLEQLGIYKYFNFVISHRFHDGMFSLKSNTPFMLYEKGNLYSSVSGDSKFTSLLKDFNLYPSNFIGRGDEVTAEKILSMIDKAIANFHTQSDYIQNQLENKRKSYLDFIDNLI